MGRTDARTDSTRMTSSTFTDTKNARARTHRRAMALAMILSVGVHAAAFALFKLQIPLPFQEEGKTAMAVETVPHVQNPPLQVLRIRTTPSASAAASREATTPRNWTPLAGLEAPTLRAQPEAGVPPLHLTRAENSPAATSVLATRSTARGGERGGTFHADPNSGVEFEAASRAARTAAGASGRDRDRGFGRRGGGIGILLGGAGCDTPAATGLGGVGRFAPTY